MADGKEKVILSESNIAHQAGVLLTPDQKKQLFEGKSEIVLTREELDKLKADLAATTADTTKPDASQRAFEQLRSFMDQKRAAMTEAHRETRDLAHALANANSPKAAAVAVGGLVGGAAVAKAAEAAGADAKTTAEIQAAVASVPAEGGKPAESAPAAKPEGDGKTPNDASHRVQQTLQHQAETAKAKVRAVEQKVASMGIGEALSKMLEPVARLFSLLGMILGKALSAAMAKMGLSDHEEEKKAASETPVEGVSGPHPETPPPHEDAPVTPTQHEGFKARLKAFVIEKVRGKEKPLSPTESAKLDEISAKYATRMVARKEFGDQVKSDIQNKDQVPVGAGAEILFASARDSLAFMADLVIAGIIPMSSVYGYFMDQAGDTVEIGFAGMGTALGTAEDKIPLSKFSVKTMGKDIESMSPEQRNVLLAVCYGKLGLLSKFVAGATGLVGDALVGSAVLLKDAVTGPANASQVVPNARVAYNAFFGRQSELAANFRAMQAGIDQGKDAPQFVKDITEMLAESEAKLHVRDAYRTTMASGETAESFAALKKSVKNIAVQDPRVMQSEFYKEIVEKLDNGAIKFGEEATKKVGEQFAEISGKYAGKTATPGSTLADKADAFFRGRFAGAAGPLGEQLKNLDFVGGARANLAKFGRDIATFNNHVDESFRLSNRASQAFSRLSEMSVAKKVAGSYRTAYTSLNKDNVDEFKTLLGVVAADSPSLAKAFVSHLGILSIAGFSAANADEKHSFLANFAEGLACRIPGVTLVMAAENLDTYYYDLKEGNMEGAIPIAVVGGVTTIDAIRVGKAGLSLLRLDPKPLMRLVTDPLVETAAFLRDTTRLAAAGIDLTTTGGRAVASALRGSAASEGLAIARTETAASIVNRVVAQEGGMSALGRLSSALSGARVAAGEAGAASEAAMLGLRRFPTAVLAMLALGTVGTAGVAMASESKAEEVLAGLRKNGLIDTDGRLDVTRARAMLAGLPPENREYLYSVIVESSFDPDRAERPKTDVRMYDIARLDNMVADGEVLKGIGRDGLPYEIKPNKEGVVVTFHSPVTAAERRNIEQSFAEIGVRSEIKTQPEAIKAFADAYFDPKALQEAANRTGMTVEQVLAQRKDSLSLVFAEIGSPDPERDAADYLLARKAA